MVPTSGVERRSLERVAARDVGELRPVELTDRADDGVRVHRLGTGGAVHLHGPRLGRVVPRDRLDRGVEVDVLAELERVGAVAEVVEQHVLRREVERPVVALRERVAVVVVRVVDSAAGIAVLPPRAADFTVLLDDHERDARLMQSMRGEQPGHAGADDDHVEVDRGIDVPRRRPTVLAPVRELLLEQRQVRRHLLAADRVLHDLQQHVVAGDRRGLRACVAVLDERVDGQAHAPSRAAPRSARPAPSRGAGDRGAGRRAAATGHP